MEDKNTTVFEYSYSSKRQEEIEKIRNKYMEKEDSKMVQLRKLDREVERPGTMVAIGIGIFGTLILGAGMSLCLVGPAEGFVLGIIIGLVGLAVLGVAYPLYKVITKRQKEKLGPQILELSEELLKQFRVR